MKPALVVIDMQNKWISSAKTTYPDREAVINNINKQITQFRENGWPIFFFTLEHEADGSTLSAHDKKVWNISGTEEAALIDELRVEAKDFSLVKRRYSCFHDTDFLNIARGMGLTHLVLCGYQLSACVLSTAMDAYQHDFHPLVLSDCVLDTDIRETTYFLDYFDRAGCLATSQTLALDLTK
jgi:nicotinamidase-related amidase